MSKGKKNNSPLINTINDFMSILKVFMFIVFVGYFFSGITVIKPDEVAIIKRMGKMVGDNPVEIVHSPGWIFALPKPFDEVLRVPVKQVRQVRVAELAAAPIADGEIASSTISPTGEGYCISGDENLCQTSVLVKYRIKDPIKAVFGSSDPMAFCDRLINDLTVAEMTKSAGRFSIDGLLTSDKFDFAEMVKKEIQTTLDSLNSGLEIIEVEIEEMVPPNYLKEAFEIVNSAFVDRKNFINNARSISEEKLPRARSNANTHVSGANEYAAKTVADANGEASKFLSMVKAYEASPKEVKYEMLNKSRKKIFAKLKNMVVYPPLSQNPSGIKLIISGNGIRTDSSLPDESYIYQGVDNGN